MLLHSGPENHGGLKCSVLAEGRVYHVTVFLAKLTIPDARRLGQERR